jgi:hypothetical protein
MSSIRIPISCSNSVSSSAFFTGTTTGFSTIGVEGTRSLLISAGVSVITGAVSSQVVAFSSTILPL